MVMLMMTTQPVCLWDNIELSIKILQSLKIFLYSYNKLFKLKLTIINVKSEHTEEIIMIIVCLYENTCSKTHIQR